MSDRRQYRKGEARREEILTAALEVVNRVGYSGTTVRELADAVGLSRSGLLHHFGTKDDLFVEILRRSDAFDVDHFAGERGVAAQRTADLEAAFLRVVRHHGDVPGLIALYIRNAALASERNHPDHEFHRSRARYAHRITSDAFANLQRRGAVSADVAPEVLATLVLALQDGLRMRWLFDAEVDMPEAVSGLFRMIELASRRQTRLLAGTVRPGSGHRSR